MISTVHHQCTTLRGRCLRGWYPLCTIRPSAVQPSTVIQIKYKGNNESVNISYLVFQRYILLESLGNLIAADIHHKNFMVSYILTFQLELMMGTMLILRCTQISWNTDEILINIRKVPYINHTHQPCRSCVSCDYVVELKSSNFSTKINWWILILSLLTSETNKKIESLERKLNIRDQYKRTEPVEILGINADIKQNKLGDKVIEIYIAAER